MLAFAVGLRWVERAITFRPERPTASEQRPAAANQTSSAPDGSGSYPGAGHNVFGAAGPAYLDQLEEFIRAAVRLLLHYGELRRR